VYVLDHVCIEPNEHVPGKQKRGDLSGLEGRGGDWSYDAFPLGNRDWVMGPMSLISVGGVSNRAREPMSNSMISQANTDMHIQRAHEDDSDP